MFAMDPNILAVLGSARRLEILRLLYGQEMAAGELATHFDVSWPAVSQHLGVLKRAGLIRERREGRFRLYSTDGETLGQLEAVVTTMWRSDLQRLGELAEREIDG